jgi:hypothetical protein
MPMAGLIHFCGLWTAVMISDVCNSYQLKEGGFATKYQNNPNFSNGT